MSEKLPAEEAAAASSSAPSVLASRHLHQREAGARGDDLVHPGPLGVGSGAPLRRRLGPPSAPRGPGVRTAPAGPHLNLKPLIAAICVALTVCGGKGQP